MTQEEAFGILRAGYNVFVTGAAGSGKTHLMNRYIDHLREHGVGVAITASTGIAATHLGGQTIHSWSGLGIRDALADDEIEKLATQSRIKRNFKHTKVLIIDEISMLHAHQLENVERIARFMGDFTKPFGGLQVILCGDFFQLPPVSKGYDKEETAFAYECPAWDEGNFQVCYLSEQFRQSQSGSKEDPLLTVLNHIREGEAGENVKALLRTRYNTPPGSAADTTLRPTRLFARNVNVDAMNARELEMLPGEIYTFTMETHGFAALVETLKKNCLAPETLILKEGAEVMFVKNATDGSYVNGTRGVVTGFEEGSGWPLIRTFDGRTLAAEPDEWRLEENGAVRASLVQVPLRLAWAITIHKSQGMTLDAAEIDLSDAFEPGMGYVALSRVRSLDGLTLKGLNDTALAVEPKVLLHDRKFREWSQTLAETFAGFSEEEKEKRYKSVLFDRFGGARDKKIVTKGRIYKQPTHEVTREFIEKRFPLKDIAEERGLTQGTIISHLEKLQGSKTLPDISYLKPAPPDFNAIKAAFETTRDGRLSPVFDALKKKYPYDTLRLVRLFL